VVLVVVVVEHSVPLQEVNQQLVVDKLEVEVVQVLGQIHPEVMAVRIVVVEVVEDHTTTQIIKVVMVDLEL
jgi:hypothetical protein